GPTDRDRGSPGSGPACPPAARSPRQPASGPAAAASAAPAGPDSAAASIGSGPCPPSAPPAARLSLQLPEHRRQLARVGGAVVAEAVVHQDMRGLRLLGHCGDARRPVGQLVLVVQVAEPLRGLDVLLLPVLR